MPLHPTARARLQIHFCVFLWGFTAILGKLITLSALDLVWWRMVIVVTALLLFARVRRGLGSLTPRLALSYAGVGMVVAVHWITFYGAVKLADASVAAMCIALAPVFLAIVEPLIAAKPFRRLELLLGLAALPGVALVLGGIPARMHLGVLVGVASALLVAVFSALNKRLAVRSDAMTVTCIELGAGMLLLTAIGLLRPHSGFPFALPRPHDAVLLLLLATACTIVPFALSLLALRHLSAYEVQLATNLEPAYAIVIASALLGERRELGASFYAGVAIVLAAVFAYPLLVRATVGRGRTEAGGP